MNTRPGGHEGRKGFTMENIKIHINYLDVYAKQLSQLTNELLGMQDKYDVTADLDQIERLSSQLEQLKAVVDTLCALPGFVDSKNEEKTERNAGYLVVSHSGGGMLRQGTRKGIRRTPANRGMRAHWVVKGLDISEDVCHGMCP